MTQTPNIPPIIESEESNYRDTGVPSTVAVAGHPLHPALITLPIGFLVTAPVTDIAYWFLGDVFWARASFWLIVGGLVTGLLAAITGLLDFIRIGRVRKHTAGWAHMYANVTALVVTAINLGLRVGNPVDNLLFTGLILSVIVATLLGISGWYGGELVYRHKIAVIGYGDKEER
ncbi:DUF2231 domain-containing protein [Allocoleopsis franciscana]|uniref:Putative membrane protein n=1 Tax=Allocoleopsis franciscana PCC 7113 TaxID=1173027 RepID=K9WEK3_9CYAN|nr:DUF2231 domain-containing protein [Allocoleopsis franciscana]AFZ18231.1 putative membrane protein [Allocoleopsis franciscana PCC 7113]